MGNRMIERVRTTFHEFPRDFWMLVGSRFIDALGSALLFPFFTLYVTAKFGVTVTQVGILFGIFSISSVLGSTLGGALTDRYGRKTMVIFGLITSAASSVLMGVVNVYSLFAGVAVFVGLLANTAGPASGAMVADLLPEEKRAQGYGILRVMHNLAVTIGPAIGGLLAAKSYLLLFIVDAIASTITAFLVFVLLPETRPEQTTSQEQESIGQTFAGYGRTLKDRTFILFLFANMLMVLAYMQMNGTLPVYLRDVHAVSERGFGALISLNAGMVVLFQFAITRRIESRSPFRMLALGSLLYVVGFGLYGLVGSFIMFMVAMVIITIGEMLTAPTGQSIAAALAPEDMRGRYMAVYGFSWTIPNAVGLYLAGLIMDHANPDYVWFAAAGIALIAAMGFYLLHSDLGHLFKADRTGTVTVSETA